VRIGDKEEKIIEKIVEIAATLFPNAWAYLKKGDQAGWWEKSIHAAQDEFKQFLLEQGYEKKTSSLTSHTCCFELLMACYQQDEKVVKNILKRVFESLKSKKVKLSDELEKPRYATFDRFFGLKYDAVRKWK